MTDEELRLLNELCDYRDAAGRDPEALEIGFRELPRMWSATDLVHGPFNICAAGDWPGWKFCGVLVRALGGSNVHQAPRWVPALKPVAHDGSMP